jgi:hypothetical protein
LVACCRQAPTNVNTFPLVPERAGYRPTRGWRELYNSRVTSKSVREYLSRIGKRGGAAGKGASKVRGDAEYYKRISRKAAKVRKQKRKARKR